MSVLPSSIKKQFQRSDKQFLTSIVGNFFIQWKQTHKCRMKRVTTLEYPQRNVVSVQNYDTTANGKGEAMYGV
jgi:hypothetical protein